MNIKEKLEVYLMEDVHGFPTFGVKYRRTRYNFCHLSDVCEFLHKVYHVNNDLLLCKQRKATAAKVIRLTVMPPRVVRGLILALAEETITNKEVITNVSRDYPQFSRVQIENQITQLVVGKRLQRIGYGQLKTVCDNGIPRQLICNTGTGS